MVANVAYLTKVYIINVMAISLFKKLKDMSQNAQNRRSGKRENCIHETCKNTVIPHGSHIYSKAYEMAKQKCVHNHS